MATYNKQDYTGHRGVNLNGSTAIRFDSGFAAGTMKADLSEGLDRAYQLPNKSGTFPIMGTFAVQLPGLTSTTNQYSTIVTVSGIRVEDGLMVQPNKGVSAGYSLSGAGGTARILLSAEAQNGAILLTYFNQATTAYAELVYTYSAVR